MSGKERKRDAKLDIKEINQKQKLELQEEQLRYDHTEIDEKNQEFMKAAKQKRKLHRKHADLACMEQESDIDEEFKLGVDEAAARYGQKRKKKYMFNDGGIPIEPFNIENDIREGALTREGVFKMGRERKVDEEEADAWYESVKDDQQRMLYEKTMKQVDSDASESEDDVGEAEDEDIDDKDEKLDAIGMRRRDAEILQLKRQLIEILEEGENASTALKRLKPRDEAKATKMKNVRKNIQKVENIGEQEVKNNTNNMEQFQKLLAISTRLQDLGYTEVFNDKRADIAHEVKQIDLQIERERQRRELMESGWHYKIIQKDNGQESEVFGPFKADEMQSWFDGGYFNENDQQFCSFIRAKDFIAKKDEWVFIDDIKSFK